MNLYNVVTTFVSLFAAMVALIAWREMHSDARHYRQAILSMYEAWKAAMAERDAKVLTDDDPRVGKLRSRIHNHSQRLNELEDLVDLLNQDAAEQIGGAVDIDDPEGNEFTDGVRGLWDDLVTARDDTFTDTTTVTTVVTDQMPKTKTLHKDQAQYQVFDPLMAPSLYAHLVRYEAEGSIALCGLDHVV